MSRRLPAAGVGVSVLALVVAASAGALATRVYLSDASPEVLAPAQRITTIAVTQATFDDSRAVTLAVDRDGATEVVSPVAGKVTALTCRPGEPLVSGQTQLAVDGDATISLATAVPLWRDLQPGDRGADVTALQQELARLGRSVDVTGTMDRRTLSAVAALLTEVQGTRVSLTAVPAARVLWLPQPSTDVTACALSVGGTVAAGDVVATVPGALRSVALVEVPAGLVAGQRTLVVDGTSVAIAPDAPITDDATLAQLSALPSMQPATGEQTEAPAGRLVLTEPVEVSVVPPSAVLVDSDDLTAGCVVGDGTDLAVRVVGSQLGQTYVLFESTAPSEVEVAPDPGTTCR